MLERIFNRFKSIISIKSMNPIITNLLRLLYYRMDNADLELLKLAPGRLNPKFSASVTEYNVLLSSAAAQCKVDCMTSDSGACYQIKGNKGDDEKVIKLNEGLNEIMVEVSAPDGTIKTYIIRVTKLAANLAELSSLTLNPGRLNRPYQKKISEYYATLGWAVNEVTIKPVKQDPKMIVDIDGNPPGNPIALVSMETNVKINVLSPDKSTTKVYTLHLMKEDAGYRPKPSPADMTCGVCSSLYQCPLTLTQCGHSFCTVCLSVTQRTDKGCPGCAAKAPTDPPYDEVDTSLRSKLLGMEVDCFYCNSPVKQSELLTHAVECESRLVTCSECCMDVKHLTLETEHKDCTATCKTCGQKYHKSHEVAHQGMCLQGTSLPNIELTGHSVSLSNWEKKLRIDSGDSFDELFEAGGKHEATYHKLRSTAAAEVQDIRNALHSATTAYANAIAVNPKSAKAHYRLGVVLEELEHVDDVYGKKVERNQAAQGSGNKEARDSSKTEEIDAICKLHGVTAVAPLAHKLQAIDKEYHALKEKGDSFRADRVQELYAWKSKQATQAEKICFSASSDETYLGKASKKYEDAVSLEPSSYLYNYCLAWSYLRRMKFAEAAARFKVCMGGKPLHKHLRYLLGISLSQSGNNGQEVETLLQEGILSYQHWISCVKRDGPSTENIMMAEVEFSYYKSQYLMGCIYLADICSDKKKKMDLLLDLIYLVPRILQTIEHRGNTYLSVESILFSALDKILSIVDAGLVHVFSKRLSKLLSKSPDSENQRLLELQVETSRRFVFVEPNNGLALTTLGDALLSLHSLNGDENALAEAEVCFRAALGAEGQPVASKAIPEGIKKLDWYRKRITPKAAPASEAAAKGKVPAGRGTPAKGAPAKRGAPAAAGRGARGGAARGGAATRGRGGAATAPRGGKAASGGGHKCEPAAKAKEPKDEAKKEDVSAPTEEGGPLNEKSVTPRLGLARVLGITKKNTDEQKSLYNEVIVMESTLHDAYIELGELCRGTLEAVDVYDKFPFSDELTFDDAYIYGEMVQILMKLEQYDDPRLEKALSGYGNVMGWNCLDTYVKKLEDAFKTKVLRSVYCTVNKKNPEDSDVQNFFRVKIWN